MILGQPLYLSDGSHCHGPVSIDPACSVTDSMKELKLITEANRIDPGADSVQSSCFTPFPTRKITATGYIA